MRSSTRILALGTKNYGLCIGTSTHFRDPLSVLAPPEGVPSFGLPTGCCILSDAAQCSELEFLLSLQELARTRTQHN